MQSAEFVRNNPTQTASFRNSTGLSSSSSSPLSRFPLISYPACRWSHGKKRKKGEKKEINERKKKREKKRNKKREARRREEKSGEWKKDGGGKKKISRNGRYSLVPSKRVKWSFYECGFTVQACQFFFSLLASPSSRIAPSVRARVTRANRK